MDKIDREKTFVPMGLLQLYTHQSLYYSMCSRCREPNKSSLAEFLGGTLLTDPVCNGRSGMDSVLQTISTGDGSSRDREGAVDGSSTKVCIGRAMKSFGPG